MTKRRKTQKKHTLRIWIFRILFAVYLAAIIWLCFGHFDDIRHFDLTFYGLPKDKIVHFCMFLPFVFFARWSFNWRHDKFWRRILIYLFIILIGLLLGAATEIGQGLTDYRSEDPLDFYSDSLGIAVGAVLTIMTEILFVRKYD
jgi:glycopeptide antibiotics resistance protein